MSKIFGGRSRLRSSKQPTHTGRMPYYLRAKQNQSSIDPAKYVREATAPQALPAQPVSHAFTDFGLDERLVRNVLARGYTSPTPIQDQGIPVLMEGRDVVGIANTGTGKTAAFLLPLIHKVLNDTNQGALILAPTRELALQIFDEFRAFAKGLPVSVCICIGGTNINPQIQHLRNQPHFVIGTPGRLKDLVQRRAFPASAYTNIVLDEVDRMLDIGFRQDILFLISQLSKERQGAFFSATMTSEAADIMHRLLNEPVQIQVSVRQTSHHVHQDIVRLQPGESKIDVLHRLLKQEEFERVIVFGRTKHGINRLEQILTERGLRVRAIHGNKSQNARQRSLTDFKRGTVRALLATDIASRGIDVENVTHVINFDEPSTYEDYIHRIGRTGRAGKAGKALTFVS